VLTVATGAILTYLHYYVTDIVTRRSQYKSSRNTLTNPNKIAKRCIKWIKTTLESAIASRIACIVPRTGTHGVKYTMVTYFLTLVFQNNWRHSRVQSQRRLYCNDPLTWPHSMIRNWSNWPTELTPGGGGHQALFEIHARLQRVPFLKTKSTSKGSVFFVQH